MTELSRIIDLMNRAYYAEAWHGPTVTEALKGISAIRAAQYPIPKAHSIWEIAHHIGVWKEVVRRRILGEKVDLKVLENFPTLVTPTSAAWGKTLSLLKARHESLVSVVAQMTEAELYRKLPKGRSPFYVQIHGVIQHDLYHAGQIVVLKKGE